MSSGNRLIHAGKKVTAAGHPFGEFGGTTGGENRLTQATGLTPRRCRQCNLGVAKPPGLGGMEWRALSGRQGRDDCFHVVIQLLLFYTRRFYRGLVGLKRALRYYAVGRGVLTLNLNHNLTAETGRRGIGQTNWIQNSQL